MLTNTRLSEEWSIELLTGVYRVDEDGRKTADIAYFRDPVVAEAFRGQQVDNSWHRTRVVTALVHGNEAYLLEPNEITLHDEEKTLAEIKERALEKLTPAERELLKLM